MYLLDINVLLALSDPSHAHHEQSRNWFLTSAGQAWATCPITENGFVRILSQPSYPGFDGDTTEARRVLSLLCSYPGHQFWADDLSILDETSFPYLSTSRHVTGQYLLALAIRHEGRLVSMDQRLDSKVLPGGDDALRLI